MTLMSGGGFWARNNGNTEALPGMKAFANFADGTVFFAPAGSVQSVSVTGSIAAGTAAVTGVDQRRHSDRDGSDERQLQVGATIAGAGVAAGTKIVAQLDGVRGWRRRLCPQHPRAERRERSDHRDVRRAHGHGGCFWSAFSRRRDCPAPASPPAPRSRHSAPATVAMAPTSLTRRRPSPLKRSPSAPRSKPNGSADRPARPASSSRSTAIPTAKAAAFPHRN